MGKFYTANNTLEEYLTELGLTFHDREESELSYFTEHKTGKQIRIDNNTKLVSLLDNFGNLVDVSSCFTDNQINEFLEN